MDRKIANYVKKSLKHGYDAASIRNVLLKSGYNFKEIDEAIHAAHSKKEFPIVPLMIILGVVVVLVAVFVLLFVVLPKDVEIEQPITSTKLLGLSLSKIKTTVRPGEEIGFYLDISNLGTATSYDIDLSYEIISIKDGSVALSVADEGIIGKIEKKITVPDPIDLGNYILRVNMIYDGKELKDALPLKFYREAAVPTCTDNKQNQNEEGVDCGGPCDACQIVVSCDDGNQCTLDEVKGGKCYHTTIRPCCGDGICDSDEDCNEDCGGLLDTNIWDRIDGAEDLAETDINAAVKECENIENRYYKDECYLKIAVASEDDKYCKNIQEERQKDNCYRDVAVEVGDSSSCEKIDSEARRDSCYVKFMAKGDYSVCEKIGNKYLRQNCESLAKLN